MLATGIKSPVGIKSMFVIPAVYLLMYRSPGARQPSLMAIANDAVT